MDGSTGVIAPGVRSTVTVEGFGTFTSLYRAFRVLRLPLGKHKKFRASLKLAGKSEFQGFIFINNSGEYYGPF